MASTPPIISAQQIEAAAKSVVSQDRTPDQPSDAKAVKKSNTVIVVLLCVLIVGAGVYLIADNANKHGGNGLLSRSPEAPREPALRYDRGLLHQQWRSTTGR